MTDTVLVTVKDKTGADVVVKSVPMIGFHPILKDYMKHHAELIEAGYSLPVFIATNKSRAIYAEIDGKVAGYIIFDVREDFIKFAYIVLGYVDPAYRGRSLYKILHEQLDKVAKSIGCSKVRSEVHPDNTGMLRTLESLGKRVTFYRVEKDL